MVYRANHGPVPLDTPLAEGKARCPHRGWSPLLTVRQVHGVKGEGGTVLKTPLDHTKEAALQAALAEVKAAVAASPPDVPG